MKELSHTPSCLPHWIGVFFLSYFYSQALTCHVLCKLLFSADSFFFLLCLFHQFVIHLAISHWCKKKWKTWFDWNWWSGISIIDHCIGCQWLLFQSCYYLLHNTLSDYYVVKARPLYINLSLYGGQKSHAPRLPECSS